MKNICNQTITTSSTISHIIMISCNQIMKRKRSLHFVLCLHYMQLIRNGFTSGKKIIWWPINSILVLLCLDSMYFFSPRGIYLCGFGTKRPWPQIILFFFPSKLYSRRSKIVYENSKKVVVHEGIGARFEIVSSILKVDMDAYIDFITWEDLTTFFFI